MKDQIREVIAARSGVYSGWILWNLFLAFIPLVLSFWLFRRKTESRSIMWWAVFVVFIAFLPNAPYVLTDVIHLIRGTRIGYPIWVIALFYIPLHVFAILMAFESYVVCLLNQGHYLKRQGAGRFVIWTELGAHALAAIGVYLGRFRRFNSWDLVTDPTDVVQTTFNDLTDKKPLVIIFMTFLIVTVFYWVLKQITLGLVLRFRYARHGIDIDLDQNSPYNL